MVRVGLCGGRGSGEIDYTERVGFGKEIGIKEVGRREIESYFGFASVDFHKRVVEIIFS